MNNVLSLAIECSKLAIMAIILFYVVELITTMPTYMRRVVQGLIILIAIMASIQLAGAGPGSIAQNRSFSMDRVPSIIAPERR